MKRDTSFYQPNLEARKIGGSAIGVELLPAHRPKTRLSFRAGQQVAKLMGGPWGKALPNAVMTSMKHGTRLGFCLGPNEWQLMDASAEPGSLLMALQSELEALCDKNSASLKSPAGFALVDISARAEAMIICGPNAARALSSEITFDLDPVKFMPGSVTRTCFAKAEILLYRISEENFVIESGRSFQPYIMGLLEEAIKQIDCETAKQL